MARTIEQIQAKIIEAKEADSRLDGLTTSSKTSIWGLFTYIIAYIIWTLEMIFDTHKSEVTNMLTELKPHTARWYRNKALAFQYGFDLLQDSDQFDNSGAANEDIAASKIIKYAAVVEAETESRLIIKVATENAEKELAPIIDVDPENQYKALSEYIAEIKDAGVKVTLINYKPDILRLNLRIYYDPLVLDSEGTRIAPGEGVATKPVETALKEFMKELDFNGELVLASLIDKLQTTPGVLIPHLDLAESKWIDPATDGYGDFSTIDVKKIPVSGYFKLQFSDGDENDSIINYIPNA